MRLRTILQERVLLREDSSLGLPAVSEVNGVINPLLPTPRVSTGEPFRRRGQHPAVLERLLVLLFVIIFGASCSPHHEAATRRRVLGPPESPELLTLPAFLTTKLRVTDGHVFKGDNAGVKCLDDAKLLVWSAQMVCVHGVRPRNSGQGVVFKTQIESGGLQKVERLRRLTSAATNAADHEGYHKDDDEQDSDSDIDDQFFARRFPAGPHRSRAIGGYLFLDGEVRELKVSP